MKRIRLMVSQNGWEYVGYVNIYTNEEVEYIRQSKFSKDSMGDPTYDTVIIGKTKIEFNEGFEIQKL